jgi:hypothetical protein
VSPSSNGCRWSARWLRHSWRASKTVLPLVWLQDEPMNDAREIERLEEHRESWASALALVQNPTFRARYVPRDYEAKDRRHLRVWLRSDVAAANPPSHAPSTRVTSSL